MARGDVTIQILEAIKDVAVSGADLLSAIISAGYGASPKAIEYEVDKIERNRESWRKGEAERIRYTKMISWLKKYDYIAESRQGGNKTLSITSKGLNKLRRMVMKKSALNPPTRNYPKKPHPREIIVIFDIPEAEKAKRSWMRSALKDIGFSMIQKSVWRGRCKIPEVFFENIKTMQIARYIEVFEVANTGSLGAITNKQNV